MSELTLAPVALWSEILPLGDHTLVEPFVTSEDIFATAASAGIVLPDTIEPGRPETGRVLAVGPGTLTPEGERIPLEWEQGDDLLFSRYGGVDINREALGLGQGDGPKLLLVYRKDVLARLKGSS